MKKAIFGCALLAAAVAFGDAANLLVTFSTPGPDKYADGTTVLDGERYALVYAVEGFEGIAADGQVVDGRDKLLAVLSRAKDGRCPTTVFQVDSQVAETLKGGSYEVVLLDTRLAPNANGVVRLAAFDRATGLPSAIAATTEVATGFVAAAYAHPTVRGAACAADAVVTAVPAGTPRPTIRSIQVAGDNVYVRVANTVPSLQYNMAGSETPEGAKTRVGRPAQGAATVDEEITIVAPKKARGGFFQVQRN